MNIKSTKINFNSELSEYRVRLFIDGTYQAGSDYFTDDKQDAQDTAAAMIKEDMNLNAPVDAETAAIRASEQADYDADVTPNPGTVSIINESLTDGSMVYAVKLISPEGDVVIFDTVSSEAATDLFCAITSVNVTSINFHV